MDVKELCGEYCIGCGLCNTSKIADLAKQPTGFCKPTFKQENVQEYLKEVCPVTGLHTNRDQELWGKYITCVGGYSSDGALRKKASSGGVTTALAIYMLSANLVDGIIQVQVDEANPTCTVCRISRTPEEVIACCGSRYSISSPWMELEQIMVDTEVYAAIGKPCDIAALRNSKNAGKYENIKYLLSFFCAGLPSQHANDRLLSELKVDKADCKSLVYRGNGWPGYTTAIDGGGESHQMEYSRAWGGILGRDIHPYCRLCLDGIGEAGDIASGDGWYMNADGTPDFTEREGRNVVFARTEAGKMLLDAAAAAGVIILEPWEDVNVLRKIQKYQYTRKATMGAKLAAYRLMGRKVPAYDKALLKKFAKEISFQEKARVFLGTIRRIVQHKI